LLTLVNQNTFSVVSISVVFILNVFDIFATVFVNATTACIQMLQYFGVVEVVLDLTDVKAEATVASPRCVWSSQIRISRALLDTLALPIPSIEEEDRHEC